MNHPLNSNRYIRIADGLPKLVDLACRYLEIKIEIAKYELAAKVRFESSEANIKLMQNLRMKPVAKAPKKK